MTGAQSRKIAEVQINRLAQYGKGFRDMGEEGRAELVNALTLAVYDGRQAERVIDTWTKQNRWMPTVADVYATAVLCEERPAAPSKHGCGACDHTGWARAWTLSTVRAGLREPETLEIDEQTYDRMLREVDGIMQRVDTARKACDCDYGKFLANARWVQKQKEMAEADGRVKQ